MLVALLPIFLAGLAPVVIGFIWYHPSVFGGAWMRMSGISPEMAEARKKKMPLMAFFGLLASMLTAYVMSFMLPVLVYPDAVGAFELAIWCWLGFIAPVMLGMVLWEGKPFRLYLINVLFWLVALIVMALILVYSSILPGSSATNVPDNTSNVIIAD